MFEYFERTEPGQDFANLWRRAVDSSDNQEAELVLDRNMLAAEGADIAMLRFSADGTKAKLVHWVVVC